MLRTTLQEKHLLFYWGMALFLAVILTVFANRGLLGYPFEGWTSAHFSTMARTFFQVGVIELKGVPIQNNLPLTSDPDAYLHWPPLFPILLSLVFRAFGASDTVAQLAMLPIVLAISLTLYFLGTLVYDKKAGLFSAFAFLVLPITFQSGQMVYVLHLAILFMLIALAMYIKALWSIRHKAIWLGLGAVMYSLSILSSWEPALLSPVLVGYALLRRDWIQLRAALLYASVGVATMLGIIGLYGFAYPTLIHELWNVVLYRTGLAPYRWEEFHIHQLRPEYQIHTKQGMLLPRVVYTFAKRLALLGQIGLLSLIFVGLYCWLDTKHEKRQQLILALTSLAGVWLLWAILMMQHFLHHEFEWGLAAPVTALALGVAASWLTGAVYTMQAGVRKTLAFVTCAMVLPAVLLLPQAVSTFNAIGDTIIPERVDVNPGPDLVKFGKEIRSTTPPGSIVLAPMPDMTYVFYSERHTIVGVINDGQLTRVLPELEKNFNQYRIYLAFPPSEKQNFRRAMTTYPIKAENNDLVLLTIAEPVANDRSDAAELSFINR